MVRINSLPFTELLYRKPGRQAVIVARAVGYSGPKHNNATAPFDAASSRENEILIEKQHLAKSLIYNTAFLFRRCLVHNNVTVLDTIKKPE